MLLSRQMSIPRLLKTASTRKRLPFKQSCLCAARELGNSFRDFLSFRVSGLSPCLMITVPFGLMAFSTWIWSVAWHP